MPAPLTEFDPLLPAAPATVPAGLALDTQFGLEEFRELERHNDRAFADTQPMTLAQLREMQAHVERASAPRPGVAPPPGAPGLPAAEQTGMSAAPEEICELLDISSAMAICRQGGRAAPSGPYWDNLTAWARGLAPNCPDFPSSAQLATKVPIEQRVTLRQVLAWALRCKRLPEAMHHLQRMPGTAWSTM